MPDLSALFAPFQLTLLTGLVDAKCYNMLECRDQHGADDPPLKHVMSMYVQLSAPSALFQRSQDLVLMPNATTGLNAVISSMAQMLTPADAVFSLDIG
jgi:hypothetical protein